jgi:glyoxylase-like metal-dependent hydrolase (beta-lactamase superfamily II)
MANATPIDTKPLAPVRFELPDGMQVFERGWLSSNNILMQGAAGSALIDSGYCTHAPQTLALVAASLRERPLDLLLNTHLHSDHCGGNAALQAAYPALHTYIPPGQAQHVSAWDPVALTYTPTGQSCPQFRFNATLQPGSTILLGDVHWEIHAAPGHDTHSIILFEPQSRVLISADALWERGFGVVFPELDGDDAFDAVGQTLDLIAALRPAVVIPGHGSPFADVAGALDVARKRLEGFVASPQKHLQYAAKVLLKFKLLEVQHIEREALTQWVQSTSYFSSMVQKQATAPDVPTGVDQLVRDLVRAGAAALHGNVVHNL